MSENRASLTRQLALLYAVIAAASFALAGVYLYRSLADQLDKRDEADLLGKVELIRHMLGEVDSQASLRANPHLFLDAMVGHHDLLIVLRSMDGETLATNVQAGTSLPEPALVPADRQPVPDDIASWRSSTGASARLVAASGRVGGIAGEEAHIILARVTSERSLLLLEYRNDALAAAIGGTLLAGLLGFAVITSSLRPLHAIAAKARQISINRLDARLRLDSAPTELQALVVAFNEMLDRVQDGAARLSRFSSDLAHELRTPIAILLGETQVALSQNRSVSAYQALLASNIEELERLSRMVDNMLFLAKADDAKFATHLEWIDLGEELSRIGEYFAGIAAETGLQIAVTGAAMVNADRGLLRRAVSNLLANAIRHTPPHRDVTVSILREQNSIVIAVRNPGPPIPPSLQRRIFERFYRDDDQVANSTSFGLGLAIVRSIMQLHSGTVSVTSSGEKGTEFKLVFPIDDRHDELVMIGSGS